MLAIFHDVNLALRYASMLFFMKAGRLVHVLEPENLSSDIIQEVYGVKSRILKDAASDIRCVVPYS